MLQKTKIFITILFSALFAEKIYACGDTTITGPPRLCPGESTTYDASTTHDGTYWEWSVDGAGAEVFDLYTGSWETYYVTLSTADPWITVSRDETELRVLSNAADGMVTLKYLMADVPVPGQDTHNIYIGAPTSSSGSLTGPTVIQNCNNSEITINLSPSANWSRTSWTVESGLSIVSQSANSITVKGSNPSTTGSKFIKANMIWTSTVGGSCGSSTITKNVSLTGQPSSNNIQIFAEGIGASNNNTLCSSGTSLIDAFYSNNIMDTWEWDLPSSWTTFVSGNHVTVTSAGIGGQNVRVRARNECGWTGWKTKYIPVEDCSGGPLFLSPNPATNEATLEEVASAKSTTKNEKEYEVKFYDNTKMKKRFPKVKIGGKLNVSTLKKGTYIVHIIDPDETVVKTRIIID